LQHPDVHQAWSNSLDPSVFAQQLEDLVANDPDVAKGANVVLVPLGTKAQGLGCAHAVLRNPTWQVLDPIPSRRPTVRGSLGPAWAFRRRGPGDVSVEI